MQTASGAPNQFHVIYCGLLMSLSAFSVDISLPFFPAIADTLSAPLSAMPSIVTVYLLFMGVGHLVFGAMSDKYGRKPVLIGTLLVFICGAVLSATASNLNELLLGRAMQGFAVGSVPVVATAMLRDLFNGPALARSMAIATGVFSIGPIVAPLLGVALAEVGGSWRVVFHATAVYAGLLLLYLLTMPETISRKSPDATQPSALLRNVKTIVVHPQSGYFLIVSAITMVPMILIVSTTPAIFQNEFGISGKKFALLFALHGTGIIIGQMLNHRLIPILGVVRTARSAAMIMCIATAAIILFSAMGWLHEYWLSFLIAIFAVGYLSVVANAMSMVLQPHGDRAGLAASLRGAIGMVVAAVGSSVLAIFVQHSALAWSTALFAMSLISVLLLSHWLQSRQHGIASDI